MIKSYVLTDNEGDFINIKVKDDCIVLEKCSIKDGIHYIDYLQARNDVEWIHDVKLQGRLKHIDIPLPCKVGTLYE